MQLPRPTHPYIPMARGFVYLVAVIDWYSRRVLAWRLSNTLETTFCVEAVNEAVARYGCPEIFNTDQGSQFTAEDFTTPLLDRGIKISMDGKGRCIDNIFVERLWGNVPAAVEFGRVAVAPVNTLRQQPHRCQEISVCF